MSKRKATTEINFDSVFPLNFDSKRPKLSGKSEGPQNKQSENSNTVAVVKPTIRPGTSRYYTSNWSANTSNTDFVNKILCACDTPFGCPLPDCSYTNVSLSELCKMLESDSE